MFQTEERKVAAAQKRSRLLLTVLLVVLVIVAIVIVVVVVVVTRNKDESMAVASDNDVCTNIGADILRSKGSGVDATIAVLLCLGAVQPQSNGIGGGGFMLVHTKDDDKVINFRERAPAAASKSMFNSDENKAKDGGLASAIPGEIAGYWKAHQKYGKLKWKDLFKPSIEILKTGIVVTEHMEGALENLKDKLIEDVNFKSTFFKSIDSDGFKPLKAGEKFTNSMLALAYQKISEEGPDGFYKGEIAENIVKATKATGGILTLKDLEDYTVTIDEPFKFEYRGQKIISAPPPASGHVIALVLQILDNFDIPSFSKVKAWNYILEAMRFGYGMRSRTGDPIYSTQTKEVVKLVQEKNYMGKIVKDHFWGNKLIPFKYRKMYSDPIYTNYDGTHTTHVSVLGPDGEAVSCTSTVNLWFGSRVMTDNGIVMNNEMDDFSIPEKLNAFDYRPSPENFIVPGKRPLSSSSPSIVFDSDGKATFVTGAAGGSRIISSTLLSLINALDWKMKLTDNLKAVRIHDQLSNNETYHEDLDFITPLDPEIETGLSNLGYNMTGIKGVRSVVTSVSKLLGITEAAGDPRKKGTGIVID